MNRRNFLVSTGVASAGAVFAPYILKSNPKVDFVPNEKLLDLNDDSIMIIIELFGGNDGLNTVLPVEYEDEYMKIRPTLNIPKDKATRIGTSDIYINSGLSENVHNYGFQGLLSSGRMAIVNGIGYDNPNLSHFRSRDIWHAGINSSDPNLKLLEGWLGNFFASKMPDFPNKIPEHPITVALGGSVPLLFKSKIGDMGIALSDPQAFFNLGKGLSPKDNNFPSPTKSNYEKEYNFIDTIARQSEAYSQAVYNAYQKGIVKSKVEYSDGLAQKFKIISALIAGGLKSKVYYVNLSNFDSHAQQMQADYKGGHANLLNQLASSVSEFIDDAVQQGFADRVAGLTISEFGRRAYDNGSRGTDHGSASLQFVFSASDNNINANYYRVEGHPDLMDLDEYGNIKSDYDFRRTYSDFLQTWLGADLADTKNVFGQEFLPFGILKKRGSSVEEIYRFVKNDDVKIYPNPSLGVSNLEFIVRKSGFLNISIFSTKGGKILDLGTSFYENGTHNLELNLSGFSSGNYYIQISNNNSAINHKLMIKR